MSYLRLILRNIEGSAWRSWVALFCAALLAAFVIGGTLIIGGAQESIQRVIDRLGADIIVIPAGNKAKLENAFLMGVPVSIWLPQTDVAQVARLAGVKEVSPQLYLSTLRGATCCEVPEMFLVAYDPQSDFTLRPWLKQHGNLGLGEAIGGSYVFLPDGQAKILIYGYSMGLKGNLEPTGTGLDQTMFFTFDTAREVAKLSEFQAEKRMEIPPGSVSAILVKVAPDSDPGEVAQRIRQALPTVEPIQSTNLFRSQRERMQGLLHSVVLLLTITWLMAITLIALVFSLVINERRREIGVLRALGARRRVIFGVLLAEALILAVLGGMAGIGGALLLVKFTHASLVGWSGVPFIIPSGGALGLLILEGLGMAILTVIPAVLALSMRISRLDPTIAMRK